MNSDTLRQVAANCRRKNERAVMFPCDWNPGRVRNPEMSGYFFTDLSAWEFIADKIDAGHPYEELRLDSPPGASAIVMKIELTPTDPLLYVKIQVGFRNKAIGRSFHYSDLY